MSTKPPFSKCTSLVVLLRNSRNIKYRKSNYSTLTCLLEKQLQQMLLIFLPHTGTVQLMCNVTSAHEQLKGSPRVPLMEHVIISHSSDSTRKYLTCNTRTCNNYVSRYTSNTRVAAIQAMYIA